MNTPGCDQKTKWKEEEEEKEKGEEAEEEKEEEEKKEILLTENLWKQWESLALGSGSMLFPEVCRK